MNQSINLYNGMMKTKIPPPLVTLAFALLMWLFSSQVRFGHFELPYFAQWWTAAACLFIGVAIMLAGLLAFQTSKTTVNPLKPETASTLVSNGIYTKTRNPMYLGMLLILAAIALALGNMMNFIGLPLFVIFMNQFQIKPEEEALINVFGEPYSQYLTTVNRWL